MNTPTREEILHRIDEMVQLISKVSEGDYSGRLDPDLPETDPLGALYRGINEVVEALETAAERALIYHRQLEENLLTIERQRAAIHELSTPVIEVWKGILCLPIVGVMDTARSVEMTRTILASVMEAKARCVIIDITGIGVVDTRTADQFIRTAKAVQLLDAQCFLTGISPVIAQTIDQMGVDLSTIATRRSLRDALKEFVLSPRQLNRTQPQAIDRAVESTISGQRGG